MFNWDDLKVLLAATRTGSLTRSAGELGVSLSTVSRRLVSLEQELGVPLFARTPEGLEPTHAALAIAEIASDIERSTHRLENVLTAVQEAPAGLVRIAALPDVMQVIVWPALEPLLERHPGLRLEVVSSENVADLTRREADIAIRTVRPERGDSLVMKRLRTVVMGLFGHVRYRDRPRESWRWIGLSDRLAHLAESRLLAALMGDKEPSVCVANLSEARIAASAGLGVTVLPRDLARVMPTLVELPMPFPAPEASLWLVGHEALQSAPRVAAVWTFLSELLGPHDDEEALLRRQLEQAYGYAYRSGS